jgi:uncharacterized repeat protein (TIGR03987 family)
MSPTLIAAVVLILAAAVIYTIAVWTERRAGEVRWSHVAIFAAGLVTDTTATALMNRLAQTSSPGLHGPLGVAAIGLMLFHTAWAAWVVWRGSEGLKRSFHRFSIVVWALWMVTLVTGFVLAVPAMLAG